jgi:hypothetical protein
MTKPMTFSLSLAAALMTANLSLRFPASRASSLPSRVSRTKARSLATTATTTPSRSP